jgi:hypothetical protein
MAVKRNAAYVAKEFGEIDNRSNRAERETKMFSEEEMGKSLLQNLRSLEFSVSKMRGEGQLLEDIKDSNTLFPHNRKRLFYFVRDKFKWTSIKDLCYANIDKNLTGDALIRQMLIECTKFPSKTIKNLMAQLKQEKNISKWIFKWLESYLDWLQEQENFILKYYLCGRDIIFDRMQNHGAYFGFSYNGNLIKDIAI